VLVRARAIEQQAFVVAANQAGEHAGGLHSGGRSMLVDPWGVVLATASDTESHVSPTSTSTACGASAPRCPALRHRRPVAARVPA
jgi:predicted amidohydrolase